MCDLDYEYISSKTKEMKGMKYGDLTVIDIDIERYKYDLIRKRKNEIKNINLHCICECKCGRTKSIFIGSLNKGVSTSCGACNTFAQYLLKTYGCLDIWSKENKESPFDLAYRSHKKVKLVCPDCNNKKTMTCNSFVRRGLSCVCGDGNSYPNKFVYKVLEMLGVKFKTEKIFNWAKNKRYDIYIQSLGCIVENHGGQHYGNGFETYGGRCLSDEIENDRIKKEIALNNGVKFYIQLDCRKSNVEWIKNSIMMSELPRLLGFEESDVDWMKCDEFACSNLARTVCEAWGSGKFKTTTQLANYLGISRGAVLKYLKQGSLLGWCDYNVDEQIQLNKAERLKRSKLLCSKKVCVVKDGVVEFTFESASELTRRSLDVLGVQLELSAISMVCNGKRNSHKGYSFRYVD